MILSCLRNQYRVVRGLLTHVRAGRELRRKPEAVSEPKTEWARRMSGKMKTEESRAYYRLPKQAVEPVFGIMKEAMGLRRVPLRGLERAEGERALVTPGYGCKRLHNMKMA